MDFTISIYSKLLKVLKEHGYYFLKFEEYAANPFDSKIAIMRHDVDRLPANAVKLAKIEKSLGIKASYYFRVVDHVWDESIMKEIASLGHEVAYHYEDVTIKKGNIREAIQHFEMQLDRFKKIYPSKTICMHGSPMSKWDNRVLWETYDYSDFGIIAEPYFDVDYSKVFYITDTGRAWNNESVSVRDKVDSGFNIHINSTYDIINLVKTDQMPDKIMINTHPHRWFDYGLGWYKELIGQSLKNSVKTILIKGRK